MLWKMFVCGRIKLVGCPKAVDGAERRTHEQEKDYKKNAYREFIFSCSRRMAFAP